VEPTEIFKTYLTRVKRMLRSRLGSGRRVVYIPPSIYSEELFKILGIPYISVGKLLFRYPTNVLDSLVDKIVGLDSVYILDADLLLQLYPRKRSVLSRLFREVDTPLTVSDRSIYEFIVDEYGFKGDELFEAGLSELDIHSDYAFMGEGSVTYYTVVGRGCLEQYINRYRHMLRDSNERYLLYYLTKYRGIGKMIKLLGPSGGMYLTRLIRKGLVVKAGRRRGIYIVRDPLLRQYIASTLMNREFYKYVGYMYLVKKAFQAVVGGISIPAEPRDIHIGEPVKFFYIDNRSFAMIDSDRGRYLLRILVGDQSDTRLIDKYPGFEYIGIYLGKPVGRGVKRIMSMGGRITPYDNISLLLSNAVGFPRRL